MGVPLTVNRIFALVLTCFIMAITVVVAIETDVPERVGCVNSTVGGGRFSVGFVITLSVGFRITPLGSSLVFLIFQFKKSPP